MKKETIEKILKDTEEGYDLIADKFSDTRRFFWRDLDFIKNYVNDGDCLLDFGCGNGRLLELLGKKDITYFGVDVSQKLLNIAEKKYASPKVNFQKISGFGSVPFEADFFNAIYAIAVMHHIPSDALRLKMAKEIYRVLKPGGFLIVTVWNLWRVKHFESVLKGWVQSFCRMNDLGFNDCYIPFKDNDGKKFYRYHHAFRSSELRDIFKKAGFRVNATKVFKQRNIILVCGK